MGVKGFDDRQVPVAIGSLLIVIAVMVCIILFGKTTKIPTKETTTTPDVPVTTEQNQTTTTTTTEYTRATTEAQEYRNTGSIIIQGNRAMEIWGKNEPGLLRYTGYICSFAEKVSNATVYMLLAPTSIEFYGPEDYHTGKNSQKAGIKVAYDAVTASNVKTVDAYKEIERYVDEEYIYFRTDHHWTARGAYHAYVAFSKVAGFEPIPLEGRKSGKFDTFLGTLYAWSNKPAALSNDPDYLEYFYPKTETTAFRYPNGFIRDEEAISMEVVNENPMGGKYTCFIEGDNPVTKITTGANTGRKVVLIKESYGNSFAPYLCDHFDEVWVIDPRKVNEKSNEIDLASFVLTHDITDVVFLNYMFAPTTPDYVNPLKKLIGIQTDA